MTRIQIEFRQRQSWDDFRQRLSGMNTTKLINLYVMYRHMHNTDQGDFSVHLQLINMAYATKISARINGYNINWQREGF